MQKIITTIKGMLLLITGIVVFLVGNVLYLVLLRKRERKYIKGYYDEKRKNFDLRNKSSDERIDNTPLEGLLKDGDYLRRRD